jgi:iron complex transport system substrate-binding protein
MIKKLTKPVAVFLILVLITSLLIACIDTTEPEETTTLESTQPAETEETTTRNSEPATTGPELSTTEQTPVFPLTITDQTDRTVTIEAEPQSIISMSPSNTEILFALGLGDKVAGVTQYCNYPAEAQEKTKIGGFSATDIDVSIEQIVAIDPDLILATETHLTEVVPKLEQFLPETAILVILTSTESFEVVFDAIELVGQCTGTEENATLLVAEMNDQIRAITDMTDTLPDSERKKVFYMVWQEPIFAIGGGTLGNTLIDAAGGVNIFGDIDGAPIVDLESIIDKNPDVILASTAVGTGADLPYQFALNEERLSGVNARINNQVYGVNDDLYGRPGPRLVEALEELVALLHPELFD